MPSKSKKQKRFMDAFWEGGPTMSMEEARAHLRRLGKIDEEDRQRRRQKEKEYAAARESRARARRYKREARQEWIEEHTAPALLTIGLYLIWWMTL